MGLGMVILRRIEKQNINEEEGFGSIDPLLLSTSTIQSITQPPKNWVVLDLSGMDKKGFSSKVKGFSGFTAGRNPGVYIHRDDLKTLRNSTDDIINYKEIVNHSFGEPRDDSITFVPSNNLFTKRLAIPKELVQQLTKYKYLSEIDKYIHLDEMDWVVYSTQGYDAPNSIIIPKAAYEKKISVSDYAEYEATYSSLRQLSRKEPVTERVVSGYLDIKQISLLLKLFYENRVPQTSYDKTLYLELKKEIENSLDKENFDSLEDVKIILSLEDIDLAINNDVKKQKDVFSIFSTFPQIPIYNYTINIYTLSQYNRFVTDIMKGTTKTINTQYRIKSTEEDRTESNTIFIIDTRMNASHPVGYLSRDNGILILGAAYKETKDSNGDPKSHQILWENEKIKRVL